MAIPVWIENFTTLPFEGTYGSDAYYYYLKAKDSAFEGKDCSLALAPAYVCLASTSLSLMPFLGVVGVNLLLILIYVTSIIVLANVTEHLTRMHFRCSVNSARIKLFVYALALNPIILWTVLRGVKETLVFLVFLLFFISMHMLLKGKFLFSTEHTDRDRFFLEKSGRYSHSKKYIETLCDKFNYKLSHFETTNLRKDKDKFIIGGLYFLDF